LFAMLVVFLHSIESLQSCQLPAEEDLANSSPSQVSIWGSNAPVARWHLNLLGKVSPGIVVFPLNGLYAAVLCSTIPESQPHRAKTVPSLHFGFRLQRVLCSSPPGAKNTPTCKQNAPTNNDKRRFTAPTHFLNQSSHPATPHFAGRNGEPAAAPITFDACPEEEYANRAAH
jgi:hypothetical protein